MAFESKTEILKEQICNKLCEIETNVNKLDKKTENDFGQYPNMLKEYSKSIKKEYKILQVIEKIRNKLEVLNSQNEKALQNIKKAKEKIDNLKQNNEQLESKIDSTKKLNYNLEKCFEFLGFNISLKEENVYIVQFSKLPIIEYNMVFTFEIFNDNNNKVKVLRVDPENCVDIDAIEKELECLDESDKFLKLIVLLRKKLTSS